jgi:hypothetical protein
MNQYIKYMDEFPLIPADILPTNQEIIDSPYFGNHESVESKRHSFSLKYYSTRKVNQSLKEWLLDTFNQWEFAAGFVLFNANMEPHKDLRDYTYNYILDTGGEDIHTNVFSGEVHKEKVTKWHEVRGGNNIEKTEELKLLESVCLEKHRWHYLRTDLNHGVTGTHIRPRIILSVIPVEVMRVNNKVATDWWIENWQKDNWK